MEAPESSPSHESLFTDFSTLFVLFITICGFLVPMLLVYPPVPPQRSDVLRETHSQLGVEAAKASKQRKQQAAALNTRGKNAPTAKDGSPTVQSLWIYPVKSCRGIEVSRSKVLPAGLEFDRLFTFAQLKSRFPVAVNSVTTDDDDADQHKWEFITLRQFPRMATLTVELWQPDLAKPKNQDLGSEEAFIVLRFPWRDDGLLGTLAWLGAKLVHRSFAAQPEKEIVLSASFPSAAEIEERGYTRENVTIWKDTVPALNVGTEVPPELQRYLGVSNKLTLFRVDPDHMREVHRCAPTKTEAGYQPITGFQDAYPLHLLNVSSVQDLASKLPEDEQLKDLDVQRFRANIIINNAPAYDEDSWKSIRLRGPPAALLQDSRFHVSCRTVRCKLPNVNPTTGTRHPVEPDKALRTHRDIDDGAPLKGCLGMQVTPLFDQAGTDTEMESIIETGMFVDVMEKGPHLYIKQ